MNECETCLFRECKNELICCAANEVAATLWALRKAIPWLGDLFSDYRCQGYEPEIVKEVKHD